MVNPVQKATFEFVKFVNSGLNHPNFFGRVVSWGILVGSLSFCIMKISSFAYARFTKFYHKQEIPSDPIKTKQQPPETEDTDKDSEKIEVVKEECDIPVPEKNELPIDIAPIPASVAIKKTKRQRDRVVEVVKEIICKNCKETIYKRAEISKHSDAIEQEKQKEVLIEKEALNEEIQKEFSISENEPQELPTTSNPILKEEEQVKEVQNEDEPKKKTVYWPFNQFQ